MMKVRMLQTVEDSNVFPIGTPGTDAQPFTVGHRSFPTYIVRVDKLGSGAVYDLPDGQAGKLINFGYADLV